ncbi:hypothetical protein [Klenkia taihuensis]|uniref:4-amino-4-deoxy-L-arabinose transferase n=1 Tax=Klenkia taihuensis TaxID=1225127 RepID=A0A1I1KFF8_9ACTN|nr:hypothetical protein [Klenkia taihuensis]GHE10308.1 hypothetical protein GCM10011381_18800 [Klenkia taihuensis]SFC59704.1 hypothetical protein SAMN05661030_1403 [Klenkia taihuensis]
MSVQGAQAPPRHRSPGRSGVRWTVLAPLLAVVVAGLVAARVLRTSPLADDGALTAPAWDWLAGGPAPDPLTPDGLAVVHTAAWGWLTRGPDRDLGLAAAGREVLWVALVLSCLLLWRVARRARLGDAGAATAVLLLGAVPGLDLLHAVSSPAAWAVPWLLLAAWLGTGRRRPAVRAMGGVALVPAVLLAPDVLLLVVAGTAAALAAGRLGLRWSPVARTVVAGCLAPVFVGLVLLLPAWDPQPDVVAPWAAGEARSVLLTAGLLAVGVLAAWWLPRWRPPAAALAATVLAAVVPPGRFAALVVCLPVGALLAGALVQELLAVRALRRARPVLLAAGAVGLVAALVASAVLVRTGPVDDFGARDRRAFVDWLTSELPPGTPVAADGLLAQDLRLAGVVIGDGGLRVARGATPPGMAGLVVARFGDPDTGLVVADPERRGPDAEERRLRRELSAALLTNPTTADAGQATGALLSGDVDPRLLTLLAGVAAQQGIGLSALPAVPGEVSTPVRYAVVDSVGGVRLADDPALVGQVEDWLAAQLPPYAPDVVETGPDGMRVGFRYVADPDALVSAASR